MTLWQEFISLEVTSTTLVPALKALLGSREDLEAICGLTGPEAQKVVDSINEVHNSNLVVRKLTDVCYTVAQAIDSPQLTEKLRTGALRTLCKLCGSCQLLPTDCVLGEELVEMGTRVGSGGFADVWQGTCGGMQVAVKRLRVGEKGDSTKLYKVSVVRTLGNGCLRCTFRGSVKKL